MLGWLSRLFRHDPYYTSYERSFERLDKEETRIQGRRARRDQLRRRFATYLVLLAGILTAIAGAYASWIYQLPEGTFTSLEGALRTSVVLVVPIVSGLMYSLTTWYLMWRDEGDTRKLEHLQKERKHILKDLKDNTHFERISNLLQKYDPEEQQKAAAYQTATKRDMRTLPVRQRRFSQNMSSHSARTPLNSSSEGGGTGLARSAGKMLMPIFDRLANSIMGDSPELLTELRQLRGAVTRMEETIGDLSADNVRLREALERGQQISEGDSSFQFVDHPAGSWEETKESDKEHISEENQEGLEGDSDGPHDEQGPNSTVSSYEAKPSNVDK